MVLESTMICFDNSDYQRNGDYFPTRLNVQKDGINLIGLTKVRSNPENNVGLLTYASSVEVLATLTSDIGRILSKMHLVQPKGNINIITGVRIAHLVLKHRQGKNHKMRIVVFVGSPIQTEEGDLVKLAKRLKKEKVNVDIVSFGEHVGNHELLTAFITTINGKDGNSSHLVTVPRGSTFPEALISSPIIRGEDGLGAAGISQAGYEFGVDPNEDPELALALRVSMEEQRQRQEAEQRRAIAESDTGTNVSAAGAAGSIGTTAAATAGAAAGAGAIDIDDPDDEEAMLQRALALSTDDVTVPISISQLDFTNMSEEEQIAIAMQMSMHDQHDPTPAPTAQPKRTKPEETPMEVDEAITDADFLQSVLESLPGVDPHSDAVRDAVGSLKDSKKTTDDKKDTDKK